MSIFFVIILVVHIHTHIFGCNFRQSQHVFRYLSRTPSEICWKFCWKIPRRIFYDTLNKQPDNSLLILLLNCQNSMSKFVLQCIQVFSNEGKKADNNIEVKPGNTIRWNELMKNVSRKWIWDLSFREIISQEIAIRKMSRTWCRVKYLLHNGWNVTLYTFNLIQT